MRVLIVTPDIYGKVGGGETVYRKLIAANPDIEFVYFRRHELTGAPRPPNARCVSLRHVRSILTAQPIFPVARLESLRTANSYAGSVAGQEFDVVELPDYFAFGEFLRDCLAFHRVRFRALVLAMHGSISASLNMRWGASADEAVEASTLEYEQFVGADARYAISKRYVTEWRARADLEVHLLDPLAIVGLPAPAPATPDHGKPDLYCIGRMEGRKGNDLFVEILRWLDRGTYGRAFHVGDDDYTPSGTFSRNILTDIARVREVPVGFLASQDRTGLARIFQDRSVVVLPVRYDPFNLLALESLLSGCPTVVSSGAGVCDYLDENLPGLPYVRIDLGNFYGAVPEIEAVLADYDGHRHRLAKELAQLREPPGGLALLAFYKEAIDRGRQTRERGQGREPVTFEEGLPSLSGHGLELVRRFAPERPRRAAGRLLRDPTGVLRHAATWLGISRDARVAWEAVRSSSMSSWFEATCLLPERNAAEIDRKVHAIQDPDAGPVYRCNVWRELARLERLRGNDLVAAAYDLRLMRMLGGDAFGQLAAVSAALQRGGFDNVALACKALYESPERAGERVYEFLQAQSVRWRKSEPREWQLMDDRRSGAPRVAVIVSLYNAAPKLRLFLTALAQQTLVRDRLVEIILVDSGSKTNELEVVKDFLSISPLNAVYARSAQRETIQAAWNRGIHLSRAPYLVFLGADETLYPDALKVLADELDGHPDVDWVMANSLVTEVDERGVFTKDVMRYDRTGGTKDHAYLETCYLSWVGGMYRRSIHERFGYYDESFRAAGDTEFKNRVLPYINVRHVPRMLGLFLNYPDERTTASPMAEIEDARAWYIHRSPGGVKFAFEHRDPADALLLFHASLGYRKSYATHISSDIEYACNLLRYALDAGAASGLVELHASVGELLQSLRRLEWANGSPPFPSPVWRLARTWRDSKMRQRAHTRLLKGKAFPAYDVFNDNRFEQHSWLWDTL